MKTLQRILSRMIKGTLLAIALVAILNLAWGNRRRGLVELSRITVGTEQANHIVPVDKVIVAGASQDGRIIVGWVRLSWRENPGRSLGWEESAAHGAGWRWQFGTRSSRTTWWWMGDWEEGWWRFDEWPFWKGWDEASWRDSWAPVHW